MRKQLYRIKQKNDSERSTKHSLKSIAHTLAVIKNVLNICINASILFTRDKRRLHYAKHASHLCIFDQLILKTVDRASEVTVEIVHVG